MNLNSLYKRFPTFQCKEGCHKCCGPVPCSHEEWVRIVKYLKKRNIPMPFNPSLSCSFITEQGCLIYPVRPLTCRAFGTSKAEKMTCPEGVVEPIVSEEETRSIFNQYFENQGLRRTSQRQLGDVMILMRIHKYYARQEKDKE